MTEGQAVCCQQTDTRSVLIIDSKLALVCAPKERNSTFLSAARNLIIGHNPGQSNQRLGKIVYCFGACFSEGRDILACNWE